MLDWQRRIEVPKQPLTKGQAIFMEYRAGSISHGDYLVFNAALVHELLPQFRPRSYPVMLPVLRGYVTGRASGATPRMDPPMSQRAGEWWRAAYAAKDANDQDASQLEWAGHILDGKLEKEAKELRERAQDYYRHPFPFQDYEATLVTMARDARERQRGGE